MIPAKKRFKVLERDKFRCQYCGKAGKDVTLEVDHVIPKSKGGSDDLNNLITCCRECNIGKGNEIIGDTKAMIMMKIKDKESEMVKDFFSTWNDYGMGTIDSRNIAFISGLIKSYFDRDTVIGYVECCLVNKIGKITDHNKYQMEDFYKGGDDCQLAIDEWGVFAWENDIYNLIFYTEKDESDLGTRNTDDYNKRLNRLISRLIAHIGKPMSLLYKYSLFPNMVETWQKEEEDY